MKRFQTFVLTTATLLFATIMASCSEQKEIKIGFIGPMTGDYANYGQLQSKGAQLAIDDFNQNEDGIGGKPVKLIVEDSQGKVDKGSTASQKLINVDKVSGLVGPVFSSVALAIAPDFQNAKIPVISASATSAELTDKGDYIFRTVPSDALQSSVLGPYIAQRLNFTTMAILFTKNDYSQSLADSVTKTYQQAGGRVLLSLGAPEGTKDFRTQLVQIKDAAPQAIFLPNYIAEIAQIIKQLSEMGSDIPIISADGFFNEEIFNLVGAQANGVIFSASPSNTSPAAATFRQRYKEKFEVEPDSFSANIYDGTTILLQTIKANYQAKGLSSEAVRQDIHATQGFAGVSGNIEFAANGDVKKGIAMMVVVDEEFQTQGIYTVESNQLQQLQ